ncbi:hypothetical protein [Amycolatopsis sp. NPDC004079]|uniref:hypothetical protein n=1 Tax=Amycolatopsis sp. NPDC004079 TaxID=3154549 RepID=UPI00339ED720
MTSFVSAPAVLALSLLAGARVRAPRRAQSPAAIVEAVLHGVIGDGRILHCCAELDGKARFRDLAAGGIIGGRALPGLLCASFPGAAAVAVRLGSGSRQDATETADVDVELLDGDVISVLPLVAGFLRVGEHRDDGSRGEPERRVAGRKVHERVEGLAAEFGAEALQGTHPMRRSPELAFLRGRPLNLDHQPYVTAPREQVAEGAVAHEFVEVGDRETETAERLSDRGLRHSTGVLPRFCDARSAHPPSSRPARHGDRRDRRTGGRQFRWSRPTAVAM